MRSLATQLLPKEIAELQSLVGSLGIDKAAELCDVSATTLARCIAHCGVYDCSKKRIRRFLTTQAATKAAA